MRDSFRLGRILDIPIGFHWSIAVIVGLFGLTLSGTILPLAAPGYTAAAYLPVALVVSLALLASIVAHELGHSVVARNNGIPVGGITLFALGGVARLEGEPRTPGAAARIALAGPAVSLAIGALGLVLSWALGTVGAPALIVAGAFWLGAANLVMAVFNMIPALPLDGGRVLQAALWHRKGDPDRATISAASVGRLLGWVMVAFGLWEFLNGGAGLWTMILGWFVLSSAKAESLRARFKLAHRTWAPPMWRQYRGPSGTSGHPGAGRPDDLFGPPSGPPTGYPRPPHGDVIDVTEAPAGSRVH